MFYEQLLKVCNEKGVKITPFVKNLDISQGNISRWKNGGFPSIEVLNQIANALNVSTDYLLGANLNHTEYLIDVYFKGVNHWSENSFFSTDEKLKIKEHFAELLSRYKQLINSACDLKINKGKDEDEKEYYQEGLKSKIDGLKNWIGFLPNQLFSLPIKTQDFQKETDNEQKLLNRFRSLDELEQEVILGKISEMLLKKEEETEMEISNDISPYTDIRNGMVVKNKQ